MTPNLAGRALNDRKKAKELLKTFNLSTHAAADPNHVGGFTVFPSGSGQKYFVQPIE